MPLIYSKRLSIRGSKLRRVCTLSRPWLYRLPLLASFGSATSLLASSRFLTWTLDVKRVGFCSIVLIRLALVALTLFYWVVEFYENMS